MKGPMRLFNKNTALCQRASGRSEKDNGRGQRLSPVRQGTAGPREGLAPFKAARPRFQEKRRDTEVRAVPKPTQVGGCKDTQARGRNLVKELGNMTP